MQHQCHEVGRGREACIQDLAVLALLEPQRGWLAISALTALDSGLLTVNACCTQRSSDTTAEHFPGQTCCESRGQKRTPCCSDVSMVPQQHPNCPRQFQNHASSVGESRGCAPATNSSSRRETSYRDRYKHVKNLSQIWRELLNNLARTANQRAISKSSDSKGATTPSSPVLLRSHLCPRIRCLELQAISM